MKKLISLILVLILILSMSTTVFAEENKNLAEGSYTMEVSGTYVAGNEGSGTVFCVDLSWENMAFTYNAAKDPVWNTTEHKYSTYTAAKWEGEGTITVTNHSNTMISAVPEFVKDSGYEQAELVFSTSKLHLPSSEFMTFGDDHTGTITVTAAGSLPAETNGKIGEVKVTLAEDTVVALADAEALLAKADALRKEADAYANEHGFSSSDSLQKQFLTDVAEIYDAYATLATAIDMYKNSPEEQQTSLNNFYAKCRTNYYSMTSQLNAFKAAE